jgi:hypothetical protein
LVNGEEDIEVSIGFVYVLLNPAFPRQLKIGRTAINSEKRAMQLSRQTGVPDDFIVIYDELVGDSERVEKIAARQVQCVSDQTQQGILWPPGQGGYQGPTRTGPPISRSRGHWDIAKLSVNLLTHFQRYFGKYLDPHVIDIELVQIPGICYLDVIRETAEGGRPISTKEELPLSGVSFSTTPSLTDLKSNEALIRSLDEYDWIMITGSGLFTSEAANEIAREWERPGGKLEENARRQHPE